MWKVGGTKIEHARAPYIFVPLGHVNSRKSDFLGKTLHTQKISKGFFWGLLTTESLRNQDSVGYSLFGWPSLRFEVIAAQSEVIGQKPVVLQKIRGLTNKSHSANFGPIALRRIEHGVHVLLVSKRSHQYWRSDFNLLRFIYDTTNVEMRVNFGRL